MDMTDLDSGGVLLILFQIVPGTLFPKIKGNLLNQRCQEVIQMRVSTSAGTAQGRSENPSVAEKPIQSAKNKD